MSKLFSSPWMLLCSATAFAALMFAAYPTVLVISIAAAILAVMISIITYRGGHGRDLSERERKRQSRLYKTTAYVLVFAAAVLIIGQKGFESLSNTMWLVCGIVVVCLIVYGVVKDR